jgi:hypothetical protein
MGRAIHQVYTDEVLKLQWPIFTTAEPKILVYNQRKSVYGEMAIKYMDSIPEIRDFLQGELKMYVLGYLDSGGLLHINEVLGGMDYEIVVGW